MVQFCWFLTLIEEIFPIPHYLIRKCRLYQKACDNALFENDNRYDRYLSLDENALTNRLTEERERAVFLDEKTFKMTLSLSVGLTVLGSVIAILTKKLPENMWQLGLMVIVGIGILYVLSAGLVAIDALRTYPSYGYGTQVLLINENEGRRRVLAESLARQEIMNNVRHVRNEAVYQAMRNGLLLISISLMFLGASLILDILI